MLKLREMLNLTIGEKIFNISRKKNINYLSEDIVSNNGSGIQLNKIWNQWNKIKTQKDHDEWQSMVKDTKFGTYGTVSFFDVLNNFEPKYPSSFMKKEFELELQNALK